MSVIHKVYFTENVTIISFEKAPAHIGFVSDLFDRVTQEAVNVDMISQTAPKGESNTISFTVSDDRVADVLAIITDLKTSEPSVVPLISSGNVKICLFGEEMPSKVGVAADVFDILHKQGIDILLITTSDVDISIVVSASNADRAYAALKAAYMPD